MALPSPILRCMSRPRSTALRLTQGHTGGAAAPRWARGRSRGEGWPLNFLSASHGGSTKRLFEFPIRSLVYLGFSHAIYSASDRVYNQIFALPREVVLPPKPITVMPAQVQQPCPFSPPPLWSKRSNM